MTDKAPQNKAETPVNTPATLARTTNTARDGEPKSRALPQADALKARFKAGSIPLQTDFADLIDLANMGRQAVGGAEGQSGPANGFILSSEGRLELKPNEAKGISVDQEGITVKVNTNNGLKMTSAGIAINDGLGIEFSSTGQLNLKVKKDGGFSGGPGGASVIPGEGITIGSSGVGVKAGNGIAVTSNGVNVKLAKGASDNGGGGQGTDGFTSLGSAGGLVLSANGLSVEAGNGIQIDGKGVSIKLAANSGLSADETNGLKIVPEQMFQKGMVMMFAGTAAEIPKGWALCDGSPGTPNLIDRFILGSKPAESGKFNSATLTGSGNTKVYNKGSSQETVTGTISIGSTKLTESQIPSHRHIGGAPYYYAKYAKYDYFSSNDKNSIRDSDDSFYRTDSSSRYHYTSSTGGGEGHAHTGTMSTSAHKHTTDVIPPYYTLAFIIKL